MVLIIPKSLILFCMQVIYTHLYQYMYAHGIHDFPCFRFPMDRGIAGYVATTGLTLNIPDAYQDDRFNR